jgi:hypothetical protein
VRPKAYQERAAIQEARRLEVKKAISELAAELTGARQKGVLAIPRQLIPKPADAQIKWIYRCIGEGQDPQTVLDHGITFNPHSAVTMRTPIGHLIEMCKKGLDDYIAKFHSNASNNVLQVPLVAAGPIPNNTMGAHAPIWQYAIDTTAMGLSPPEEITPTLLGVLNDWDRPPKDLVARHTFDWGRVLICDKKRLGEGDFIATAPITGLGVIPYWLVIQGLGSIADDKHGYFMALDQETIDLYKQANNNSLLDVA